MMNTVKKWLGNYAARYHYTSVLRGKYGYMYIMGIMVEHWPYSYDVRDYNKCNMT